MIRGKVSAITAFFNSIAESSNVSKATTIHEIQKILPAAFELINTEKWTQLATTDNVFENVVRFLAAYAGNEDFTQALDPNKASDGDAEEAMKIYVAALYEMRLQQQEALVSIVHTLPDADQMELTNIVSYLDHKERWSSSRAWAGVLYEACQVPSSPLSISDTLNASVFTPAASRTGKAKAGAVHEQSAYATPRSAMSRLHSTRSMGRGASAGDSPLLQHLNSPRGVDQTQLKQLHVQAARLKAEVTDLRRSVHDHENTEADLRDQLNVLNTQKLSLEDRYRRARDEASNASSLRRQVTELEEERKSLAERLHRLETHYVTCKASLEQSDKLRKDAHLEAERATDAYEAEKLTVVDLRRKIADMTDELAHANEVNKNLQETNRRLREDEATAKARFEETEVSWSMRVDNLKTALENKEADYIKLIDTNNEVTGRYLEKINTLNAELHSKRLEVEMLTERVEHLEASSEDMMARGNAQVEEVRALEAQLLETTAANEAVRADLERRLDQQTAAYDVAARQLAERKLRVEELTEELRQLRDSCASAADESEATNKKLLDDMEAITRAMERCEERENEASTKYSEAIKELQKMRGEIFQLKHRALGLEQELADLRRHQADETELQKQLRTREVECNILREQNNTLSQTKTQMQRRITDITEELDRLRGIIQQMQAQQRDPSFSDRAFNSSAVYAGNEPTLRSFATSTPLRPTSRQPPALEQSAIHRGGEAAKPPSGRADDFSTPVKLSRSRSVTEQNDVMSITSRVSRVDSSSRGTAANGLANPPPLSATNRPRGVSSPPASDSARAAELRERNRKLPPHMRSHYAVEPLPPQFDMQVRGEGASGRRDEGFQRASTIRLLKHKSASPSYRGSPAKTSKAEPNP